MSKLQKDGMGVRQGQATTLGQRLLNAHVFVVFVLFLGDVCFLLEVLEQRMCVIAAI